jgi:hypothetical protein
MRAAHRAETIREAYEVLLVNLMIIRMTTRFRPQQRYDHRLRDLVRRTGDLTIAADLGVPRSTAWGWLRPAPTIVGSLEVADLDHGWLKKFVEPCTRTRRA